MSGSTYSALPPSSTTPELDGDFPNALADRVLQLHSRSQGASQPSPTAGRLRSLGRIVGSRASSGNDDNEHKASALSQDEQQSLLNDSDRSDDTDDEDQATHARSKRSRKQPGTGWSSPLYIELNSCTNRFVIGVQDKTYTMVQKSVANVAHARHSRVCLVDRNDCFSQARHLHSAHLSGNSSRRCTAHTTSSPEASTRFRFAAPSSNARLATNYAYRNSAVSVRRLLRHSGCGR